MIEGKNLSQFSLLSEMTFVETGVLEGQSGYWFSERDYKRKFVTESEIFERLERRKASLFNNQ